MAGGWLFKDTRLTLATRRLLSAGRWTGTKVATHRRDGQGTGRVKKKVSTLVILMLPVFKAKGCNTQGALGSFVQVISGGVMCLSVLRDGCGARFEMKWWIFFFKCNILMCSVKCEPLSTAAAFLLCERVTSGFALAQGVRGTQDERRLASNEDERETLESS